MVGYSECETHSLLREKIQHYLIELSPIKVISGMAQGVDQIAAEVAMDLFFDVVAAVPFEGQETLWPEPAQIKYWELLLKCVDVREICEPGYAAWKMMKRNQWMVDNCDVLIAVWDGSSGGTKNCVDYATSKEKTIIRIDPKELKNEQQ